MCGEVEYRAFENVTPEHLSSQLQMNMFFYWEINELWTAHTMLRTLYKVHERNERLDCHRNMLHIKIHGINRKLFLDMKVYRAE